MLSKIGKMTVETTLVAAELTETGDSSSRLDIEIESIRRLMMKVSQKQQTTTRKRRNFSKGKTKAEYESIAGGRM